MLLHCFALGSVSLLAWFGWGLAKHFKRVHRREPLGLLIIKLLFPTAAISGIAHLLRSNDSPGLGAWCLLLSSAVMFAWAVGTTRQRRFTVAYSSDTPRFLEVRGPYRFVRHPFYTSYILYFASFAAARPSPITMAGLLIVSSLYVHAAAFEERKFRRSEWGRTYEAYCRGTGRFLPRVLRSRGPTLEVSPPQADRAVEMILGLAGDSRVPARAATVGLFDSQGIEQVDRGEQV